MPIDLAAAVRKLNQAEILCAHLKSLAREIALDMRRRVGGDYQLVLETYFSACIGAARSSFYILRETGGPQFTNVSSKWRNHILDQGARTRFNALLSLRDRDVHYGELSADALPKMIEIDYEWTSTYQHNAALFGPAVLTEHKNPDGEIVRAGGLQGSVGLYVEIAGRKIDAATACLDFISLLRSLLRAAEDEKSKQTVSPTDQPNAVAN